MKFKTIFSFVMLLSATLLAEELEFRFADGLELYIYDSNVAPENNQILSNYHNTQYVIDGEGYIQLGSFGRVKIAGLTVDEATELLLEKFSPYGKNLNIIVIPMIRIVLRGEFNQSGMYRFSPTTSLWEVIEQAGGMSSSFAQENMYIIRQGDILYRDFQEALYVGTSLQEIGIQSGDEIIAPRINRISFNAVMRYVNFFASLILLYYALRDEER